MRRESKLYSYNRKLYVNEKEQITVECNIDKYHNVEGKKQNTKKICRVWLYRHNLHQLSTKLHCLGMRIKVMILKKRGKESKKVIPKKIRVDFLSRGERQGCDPGARGAIVGCLQNWYMYR